MPLRKAAALAGILGPGLFTGVLARSLAPHPGLATPGSPFYLAGLMLVAGLVVLLASSIVKPERALSA